MATDTPLPTWRNFLAWSVVGALVYVVGVSTAMTFLQQDPVDAIHRPTRVLALLGMTMLLSMAAIGFAGRKRAVTLRGLRNILIQNAVAVALFLLALWGFRSLGGEMGVSETVAAITGLVLVVVASFGALATASVRLGAKLFDDELAADEMRERGRLLFCSFAWIAAGGLLLIGLGLAGPGGVLSPAAALAGALVLIALLVVLGIAAWQLSDELGRTLSHETGNMAFYLIFVLGSGWAMLAHLGFVAAPAPLDWLTLFTVALFVASFIAAGRRKLLTA